MDNNLLVDFTNQLAAVIEKMARDVAQDEILKSLDLMSKQKILDDILTVEEAAKYLKVSVPTIYRWKSEGKLNFAKNGNKLYFFQNDLYSFIKRKKTLNLEELSKIAESKFNNLNNSNKIYGY